jgi:hypothetical protein
MGKKVPDNFKDEVLNNLLLEVTCRFLYSGLFWWKVVKLYVKY